MELSLNDAMQSAKILFGEDGRSRIIAACITAAAMEPNQASTVGIRARWIFCEVVENLTP